MIKFSAIMEWTKTISILLFTTIAIIILIMGLLERFERFEPRDSVITEIRSISDTADVTVEAYLECKSEFISPGKVECQTRALQQVELIQGKESLPEARKTLETLIEKIGEKKQ